MKKNIYYLFYLVLPILLFSCKTTNSQKDETPHSETFFDNWPQGRSPQTIGKQVALRFLETPHTRYGDTRSQREVTQITYPDVCTWIGGLWFSKVTKDSTLFTGLKQRFEPLFDEESNLLPQPNHVDNNVFGALAIELFLQTQNEKYLDLGMLYADSQWTLPESASEQEKAYHDNGYSWQTRIWIDDMFMMTAVQAQAYRATGNENYINRSAKEMVLYLDSIQLENGLFYHSPEAPFSWGRGNGWMAVGMPELLRILPEENPYRGRILEGYEKMMETLLKYQTDEGMWRQIIDDEELWLETSSTAMFTYAMITGVKNGWLDKETYGPAARRGWLALTNYLDENSELKGVCEGTNVSNNRESYINRRRLVGDLHGQAPLLWCATALLR